MKDEKMSKYRNAIMLQVVDLTKDQIAALYQLNKKVEIEQTFNGKYLHTYIIAGKAEYHLAKNGKLQKLSKM